MWVLHKCQFSPWPSLEPCPNWPAGGLQLLAAAIDFLAGARDCLFPWQGRGRGPDVQIPCGLELRVAAAVRLLRGVWEAGPSCDEEGELRGCWGQAVSGLLDCGILGVSVISAL